MARKATPKLDGAEATPQVDELKKETYLEWISEVASKRKKLDDAQIGHAAPWKRCDALRINPKAAKMCEALARMDPREAQICLRELNKYAGWRGITGQLDILDSANADPAKVAEVRDEGAKAAHDGLPREHGYTEPVLAANWEAAYDEIKALQQSPTGPKRSRAKKADAPAAPKTDGDGKIVDPDQSIIDEARRAFEANAARTANPYNKEKQRHEHGIWDAEWMVQSEKAKWAKTQQRQPAEPATTH